MPGTPTQPTTSHSLQRVAWQTADDYFRHVCSLQHSMYQSTESLANGYKVSKGLFVTFSTRGNKSRACWGSLEPKYPNLVQAAGHAVLDALTKDYRYPPITLGELADLKVQISIIDAVQPIRSLHGQNPLKHGLLIRAGGRSGLSLPGESLTVEHQLSVCKHKAGLHGRQPLQMYRILAHVEH